MEFSSMGTRPRLGASASPDPEENSPVAWGKGQGQRLESLRRPPSAPFPQPLPAFFSCGEMSPDTLHNPGHPSEPISLL